MTIYNLSVSKQQQKKTTEESIEQFSVLDLYLSMFTLVTLKTENEPFDRFEYPNDL